MRPTVNDVHLIDALTANWNGNCQVMVEQQQLVLSVYWTQSETIFAIENVLFFFSRPEMSISLENWLKWVQLDPPWKALFFSFCWLHRQKDKNKNVAAIVVEFCWLPTQTSDVLGPATHSVT